MKHLLTARMIRGAWHLHCAPAAADAAMTAMDIDAMTARGRAVVLAFRRELGVKAGVWQLEMPKWCLGEAETRIGLAETFAERCVAEPDVVHRVIVQASHVCLGTIGHALTARGARVHGGGLRRWAEGWRWRAAAAMALMAGLWTAFRHGGVPATGSASAFALAVHGEWSNRTRHVLQYLDGVAERVTVLVLGRPRQTLAALDDALRGHKVTASIDLVRPYSLTAAIGALPTCWHLYRQGGVLLFRCPLRPAWSEQMAVLYRIVLGVASAEWWRSGTLRPRRVIFGHTGVADTTLLESAMQAEGCATVHVVHGVSAGVNFTGRSDDAWFRCGHDADWHAALGGYGRCLASIQSPSNLQHGSSGMLLLSNLAHPMNPDYRAKGTATELSLLHVVAKTVSGVAAETERRTWRPHPAYAALPQSQRRELVATARDLGFEVPEVDTDLFAQARAHRYILCTASTVIIDLLSAGMLPIMLDWQASDPDTALAAYPLRAKDANGIADAMRQLDDADTRQALYAQAWRAIRPARFPALEELLAN